MTIIGSNLEYKYMITTMSTGKNLNLNDYIIAT